MKRTRYTMRNDQRGVVSMIIVLFSALLMTIIVVSFMTIMLKNQQQATSDDLSKSAYDSAMAGVEDAKRAIALCNSNPSHTNCNNINDDSCDILERIGVSNRSDDGGLNPEYRLQTAEGTENTLDQAYTCVTINSSPDDYQTDLTQDQPLLIPLQASSDVQRLRLNWSPNPAQSMNNFPLPNGGFETLTNWNSTRRYPPVMRAQLIRLESGGRVSDLKDLDGSRSSTLFLYPVESLGGGQSSADFASDVRQRNKGLPTPVQCTTTSCNVNLRHGSSTISGSGQPRAYLLLTPLYGNASVSLQMQNGAGQPVYFVGTQAVIDSTGRANTLFRRVSARVDLIPHPVYPNSALNLTGPLCKNFTVTTSAAALPTCS